MENEHVDPPNAIEPPRINPRALTPLQHDNAASRFAYRLHQMRDRLGMSSRQIAEEINISESTLSRHFSGTYLTRPKTLKALHDLLAAKGIPASPEEKSENWKLLNAAWSEKGPLPAHYCGAVRALEQIEQQLEETSAEATKLRAEMRAAEEQRQRAEQELAEFRAAHEQLTEEQQQRLGDLTTERDDAVARVRLLEDRIKQMESLSRLLVMQQHAVGEVVHAAEVEVARWQNDPEPAASRMTQASPRREMEEFADKLHRLTSKKDSVGAYNAAKSLLEDYTPEQAAEVWEILRSWSQWDDAKWLLEHIALNASGPTIAQISKAECFKEDKVNEMLWTTGKKGHEHTVIATIIELRRGSREGGAQRLIQAAMNRIPAVVKYRSSPKQKRGIFFW
ncbi:helix-turn-helix domain-containing protein [Streptomyces sp. NPDC051642]|uniref:helix-turn-helix domain-containing protein n=1 Tax=Streptomyces sp. NPDC051642 TaxID=3154646 RepID=UPI00343117D4